MTHQPGEVLTAEAHGSLELALTNEAYFGYVVFFGLLLYHLSVKFGAMSEHVGLITAGAAVPQRQGRREASVGPAEDEVDRVMAVASPLAQKNYRGERGQRPLKEKPDYAAWEKDRVEDMEKAYAEFCWRCKLAQAFAGFVTVFLLRKIWLRDYEAGFVSRFSAHEGLVCLISLVTFFPVLDVMELSNATQLAGVLSILHLVLHGKGVISNDYVIALIMFEVLLTMLHNYSHCQKKTAVEELRVKKRIYRKYEPKSKTTDDEDED